jgi:hypothetical protein
MLYIHIREVNVYLHSLLTLAFDGGEWPALRPDHFISLNEHWFPLEERLSGPQSQSGQFGKEKNFSPFPGFEPQNVQPVA